MYEYFMEYCKPYRQLMPVEYQKQDDGQYHKVRMACRELPTSDVVDCGFCEAGFASMGGHTPTIPCYGNYFSMRSVLSRRSSSH